MTNAPIEVLYRSERVAVVNKPSGIVVHRSAMANDKDVAMMRARDTLGVHVWPVHRLDRGTSGALAFALTEDAARELREAFDAQLVRKEYIAIARGEMPEHVVVDYAVPKSEDSTERVDAVTEFERVHMGEWFSVVRARPRTGRYHQIRRHLSHLRHPLACDSSYGTGWFNRKMRADTGLTRLALHACSIHIPGEPLVLAPLSEDLCEAFRRLGVPSPGGS